MNKISIRLWGKRRRSGAVLKKKFDWKKFLLGIKNIIRSMTLIGLIGILVFSPLLAWHYLSENDIFTIERVSIYGDIQYMSQVDLRRITDSAINQNFIGFDVISYQKKLQEEPWVKSVKVNRLWFDELEVMIEEERPVAIWNSDQLIDKDGKRFTPSKFPEIKMANLVGEESYAMLLLERLAYVKPRLNQIGVDIDAIVLDERLSWSILLDNQIVVELGTEAFIERFQRLLNHYENQISLKADEIMHIDFRYSNGFSVGWKVIEYNDVFDNM